MRKDLTDFEVTLKFRELLWILMGNYPELVSGYVHEDSVNVKEICEVFPVGQLS